MRLIPLLITVLLAAQASARELPALRGDAEAVARIEKMYSQIGGRQAWAGAESIYIFHTLHSSSGRTGSGIEYDWRDLSRPRERAEYVFTETGGRQVTFARGYDETRGWRRRPEGNLVESSPGQLKAELLFWKRDFYTMFKRLAVGDPAIRYKFSAPNRIDMTDTSGQPVGFWEIDQAGWLLRWGTTDAEGEAFDWYYGPYRRFGRISFPAWAVSAKFLLRVDFDEVGISFRPLPEKLLRNPERSPPRKAPLR